MIKQIGLLDYDVLKTRYYMTPNYDLGVVYAYYKDDRNVNIRLISSCSPNNLEQYDVIYIFKQSKELPHPVSFIKDYYKLPVEEFGPGFLNRPLRPNALETRFLAPDFSCYNNMIIFSISHPYHKISWKIDKKAKGAKYQPIRLYEEIDGEELKKDYPIQKGIILYDDPISIINNNDKWTYFNELIDKKHKFLLAQTLDISKIQNTNILKQIISIPKYACLRYKMKASKLEQNLLDILINTLLTRTSKNVKIIVDIPKDININQYIIFILLLNEYNRASGYKLRLVPYDKEARYVENDFASLVYRYMLGKPHLMSCYEYIFNIVYLRMGVPKELIHTGEDRYEYILSQYGPSKSLQFIENWIQYHKEYEYLIFLGGDSDYGEQRKKYYDQRRSDKAFGGSIDDISTECGAK